MSRRAPNIWRNAEKSVRDLGTGCAPAVETLWKSDGWERMFDT